MHMKKNLFAHSLAAKDNEENSVEATNDKTDFPFMMPALSAVFAVTAFCSRQKWTWIIEGWLEWKDIM